MVQTVLFGKIRNSSDAAFQHVFDRKSKFLSIPQQKKKNQPIYRRKSENTGKNCYELSKLPHCETCAVRTYSTRNSYMIPPPPNVLISKEMLSLHAAQTGYIASFIISTDTVVCNVHDFYFTSKWVTKKTESFASTLQMILVCKRSRK